MRSFRQRFVRFAATCQFSNIRKTARIVATCSTSMLLGAACVLAQDLPSVDKITAMKLFEVPSYCEGVVFDHDGKGYISWDKTLTEFQLDGTHRDLQSPGLRTDTKSWPTVPIWSAMQVSMRCSI